MNRAARERNARKVQATRDRRARADAAPRLLDVVPPLRSLRLDVYESDENGEVPGSRRGRPFVVDHAAAWFELPCIHPECQEGGHDVTDDVMRSLEKHLPEFEGSSTCRGQLAEGPCRRALHFVAIATYGDG